MPRKKRDNTIGRLELVADAANMTGQTETDCRCVLECLFGKSRGDKYHHGAFAKLMADGRHIELRGFGTFYPKVRKARPARNLQTGEVVPLPQRLVALFRFSPEVME